MPRSKFAGLFAPKTFKLRSTNEINDLPHFPLFLIQLAPG